MRKWLSETILQVSRDKWIRTASAEHKARHLRKA